MWPNVDAPHGRQHIPSNHGSYLQTPPAMSTLILAQRARPDDDADVQRRPSIPLAPSQTTTSTSPGPSSNRNVVSGPITAPSTSTTALGKTLPRTPRRESAKSQLYERCSQQMLVIACMFVGCVLVHNGTEKQTHWAVPPVLRPRHWRSMDLTIIRRCEFRLWLLLLRPGSPSHFSFCPQCKSTRSSRSNGSVPFSFWSDVS